MRSEVLCQAIGIRPHQHDRRSIREIARAQNRPVEELIRDLDGAIASARQSNTQQKSPPGKEP